MKGRLKPPHPLYFFVAPAAGLAAAGFAAAPATGDGWLGTGWGLAATSDERVETLEPIMFSSPR
jgi:hypothetical protein